MDSCGKAVYFIKLNKQKNELMLLFFKIIDYFIYIIDLALVFK